MATPSESSPFRPGYNQRPPVLAGRDDVLAAADEALAVAVLERRTPTALLVVGPRGTGKTVLLGEIADRAGGSYGWPRLHVEVTPGASFSSAVVVAAARLVAVFEDDPPKGRLRATSAVVGANLPGIRAEVTMSRGDTPAATGRGHAVDEALARAVAAARARQSGFLITLDEMQLAAREELAALAAALQAGIDADWPVVMVGAGLAGMRDPGRAVSYFERAEWHEIGSLNPTETRRALEEPAAEAGRPLDDDALELLVGHSGGYPYAVQLYGHHAWRAATGRDRIDLAAATEGAASATKQLEVGLYANRWTQASPAERRYLTALAGILRQRRSAGGADVAAELGVTTRQVSYLRDRLIKKGTITVEGDRLGFSIPGLAEYIRRQGNQFEIDLLDYLLNWGDQPVAHRQESDAVSGVLHRPLRGPAGQISEPAAPLAWSGTHQPMMEPEEIEPRFPFDQMHDPCLFRLG